MWLIDRSTLRECGYITGAVIPVHVWVALQCGCITLERLQEELPPDGLFVLEMTEIGYVCANDH